MSIGAKGESSVGLWVGSYAMVSEEHIGYILLTKEDMAGNYKIRD
jgi:hypothetical protein